jgi:hypothetical protein
MTCYRVTIYATLQHFCTVQWGTHNNFFIIMFVKGYAFFLFLNPQSGVGPSISSSAVPRSFFPVCISVPVLVSFLCPSSVGVIYFFVYNSPDDGFFYVGRSKSQ